jgi:hypothetical protein
MYNAVNTANVSRIIPRMDFINKKVSYEINKMVEASPNNDYNIY